MSSEIVVPGRTDQKHNFTQPAIFPLFDYRPPWDGQRDELMHQRHLMDIHYGNFFTTFELDIHGWYPSTIKRVQQLHPYIISIESTVYEQNKMDMHDVYYQLPGNPVDVQTGQDELLIMNGEVQRNQLLAWSVEHNDIYANWWNSKGIDFQNAVLATKLLDVQRILNADNSKGPAVAMLSDDREGESDVWYCSEVRNDILTEGLDESIRMHVESCPLLGSRDIIDFRISMLAEIDMWQVNMNWKGKSYESYEDAPLLPIYPFHPELFAYKPLRYRGIMSPTIIDAIQTIGRNIFPEADWNSSEILSATS